MELASFIKHQVYKLWLNGGVEWRLENRCQIAVPVSIQPVDPQFNAVGAPFSAVTRDISPQGIGFVHAEHVDHTLLAIQMSLADKEANLVVRVRWCKELDPLYLYGASFVARLESFPVCSVS
ncbi:MAG: PilZ domain-containing protein [Pirellulaceae bacterium]|nr:PilZ domain-containing protein [Pirellulaceae bacterium]